MPDIRPKDLPDTSAPSDGDEIILDSFTGGTRRTNFLELKTQIASDFLAAPTDYKQCPLNTLNKIPTTYLSTSESNPKGAWDATSNSPGLIDGGSNVAGDYYDVTVAGTQTFGGTDYTFVVGDVIKYNGTVWYQISSVANFYDGTSTQAGAATTGDYFQTADVNDRQLSKAPSNGLYFSGNQADVASTVATTLGSAGDGTQDLPLSGAAVMRANDYTSAFVMGRQGSSSLECWWLEFDASDKLFLTLFDESASSSITLTQDVATVVDGEAAHVAFTYDGTGGASAANGATLYINGVAVAATAGATGTYEFSEALSQATTLGLSPKSGRTLDGDIASAVLFNRELTPAEILRLSTNGNVPEISDQWGNDTEILGNPGFEVWDSASNAGTWNEGALITVAQDGVNKYSGSYACHYTSSGSATTSGAAHQLRQGDLVPVGQNYASVIVKNAAAGAFSIGVNNDRFLTFDGTSLTDTSSEVTSQYPGSSLNNYRLTDLGSGWFKIDLWFLLVATSARDFVLGGTGQWYIDDASNTKAGAVLSLNPDNIDSAQWRDSSSNGLSGTITGATPLMEKRALHINAASPAADEKLLTVSTAGVEKASIDEDGDAVVQKLNIAAIPTASAGLASGDVWSNSGVLTIIA